MHGVLLTEFSPNARYLYVLFWPVKGEIGKSWRWVADTWDNSIVRAELIDLLKLTSTPVEEGSLSWQKMINTLRQQQYDPNQAPLYVCQKASHFAELQDSVIESRMVAPEYSTTLSS